ncbi:MAG: hypothetical protein HYX76_11160 [Acidobacteria bacterium]|nr:hypothetical protein [Acidobacteriota bacterium]
MVKTLGRSDPRWELVELIRRVRRRWRLKLALRGAATLLATGLVVLLAAAWGLESARFSPRAIVALRMLVSATVLVLAVRLLVRPLLRRVTDEQVALYLEEHEPSLQAEIVSAVDASRASAPDSSRHSAALVERLVECAVETCAAIDGGRRIERASVRRDAAAIGLVAITATAVFLLGPAYLRHALSALLLVSRSVEAAAPYRIDVTPGDATVPRGADLTISARLRGFEADQAVLMVRKGETKLFQTLPLVRGAAGQYDGMLFDLAASVEYFVEAAGVRSRVFKLHTVDLPYVERLELEYRFPVYTGLSPVKVEDGGDIAVLGGTEVGVRVISTIPTRGGRIVLHDKTSVPLEAAGNVLTARFTADRDGFYRIELDAPSGERVAASPQYTIDVLSDQPPFVSFSRPGRDTTASPLDEVFLEVRAEDDYGVRDLELVYSVNGQAEQIVKLFDGRSRRAEISAGHTLYLENINVQPGDSISYYARAADNDTVQGAKRATSDLYFLRVRPFHKEFRRAESQAGGGGGAGQVDALSEQQRQIIAATFNVQRDRKTYTPEKLRESTVLVALAQARLREQVEGLVTRMTSRLVEPDPAFENIASLLPRAVTEMKAAETKLQAVSPEGALPPENRALQFLQKAEEEYELQVSVSRNGSGGGSGSMAEDLADLFELDLDRMANQYETIDRGSPQNPDRQLDALMEKLKELARRQEQEAERQRRRAAAGQGSAGGGAQQRALAEQVEEAARRLERLSRDENRPELTEPARRLREAANAMRRAAGGGDPGAAAQASAALGRLREAERQLRRSRSERLQGDVDEARRRAEELSREQTEISEDVRGLPAAGNGREDRARRLAARKDALDSKVAALEKELDRIASDASADERDASRKLAQAAGTIRDKRIRDKIRYAKRMVESGLPPESVQALETDIGANLEALKDKIGDAASALGRTKPDSMAEALEKARRLARGLDSLDQRVRERVGRQGRESTGSDRGGQDPQDQRGRAGEQAGSDRARTADGQRGEGDTSGQWSNGYGFGDRRPGRLSHDDIRQFRGEVRQWSHEAQELRRLLREQDIDPKELDAILRALRTLEDERVYQDVAELERLQTFVTEGLKRFEYGLRRRAEARGTEIVLSGTDEVPEQFRKLVEEYYRSLSKSSPKIPR